MASENACALQSREKYYYSKQNITSNLIEILYLENVSFRDRDLKRFKRCHMASENFDAELLLNIRVSMGGGTQLFFR